MMRPTETVAVRLCRESVDFRKSIDGLAGLVEQTLGLDPFNAELYVFTNHRHDKLKILYWDRSGFALWYKRLEKARFPWPGGETRATVELSARELGWLLDGIDFFRLTPHETLSYRSAG
ncbi:MAG: IS66 family insertion sequence element accessory protein TnpB [Myxococcota bacterium]